MRSAARMERRGNQSLSWVRDRSDHEDAPTRTFPVNSADLSEATATTVAPLHAEPSVYLAAPSPATDARHNWRVMTFMDARDGGRDDEHEIDPALWGVDRTYLDVDDKEQ